MVALFTIPTVQFWSVERPANVMVSHHGVICASGPAMDTAKVMRLLIETAHGVGCSVVTGIKIKLGGGGDGTMLVYGDAAIVTRITVAV